MKSTKYTFIKSSILGIAVLTLTACGGGGGGGGVSSAATPAPAPAPDPEPQSPAVAADFTRGVITGFGSVFINGTRFTTDSAEFSKDDSPSSQDDLKVGMVVEVSGSFEDGSAARVAFDEDIKGPVDAVSGDTLTVVGQTVQINGETVFDDNLNQASISVGDILEISGFRGMNDSLEASFIERKTDANTNAFKVIGPISNLDSAGTQFSIGGLSVDYNSATLDDLNGNALANGMLVEVKDENKSYAAGDLIMIASKIEPVSLLSVNDNFADDSTDDNSTSVGQRVEIQGLISSIDGGSSFVVASTTVLVQNSTAFLFGDQSLLSVGSKVEVQGVLNADGALEASKIKFSRNAARIEAIVDTVDVGSETVTMLGITVRVGDVLRAEDKRDDLEPFGINDIMAGDFVEVRGIASGGVINARELERDDNDDTRVRGPVADIDADNRQLSLLGVAIVTDSATQYEGFNDEILSAEAFFAELRENQTLVDAQWDGVVSDLSTPVKELSLED